MTSSAQKIMLKAGGEDIMQFRKNCGAARYAFNWARCRWLEQKVSKVGRVSSGDLRKEFNANKADWMYESSKGSMDRGIKNFVLAKNRHYANPKQFGFPKKKNRFGRKSFYIENDKARIVDSMHVRLPLIKNPIELAEEINPECLNGKVNNFVVSEGANGKWYVSISYSYDEEKYPLAVDGDGIEGIDIGIKTLMTLSSGNSVDNPHFLKKKEARLKRYRRMMSHRTKGSRNRSIIRAKLKKLHAGIANTRKDFLHKATTEIVRHNMIVCVEDLHTSGMLKTHGLAKAISDASFSTMLSMLDYKCNKYGSTLVKIGRFFPSSKKCSNCGNVKENLSLSEREYICEHCGCALDRDYNAAVNILAEGLFILLEKDLNTDAARRKFTPAEMAALARSLLVSSETAVGDAASRLPSGRKSRTSNFIKLLGKKVVDKTTV